MSNDIEAQLSEQGKTLLAIMRDSMQQGVIINEKVGEIIAEHMGVTESDWKIIADCLEADIRAMLATYRSGM